MFKFSLVMLIPLILSSFTHLWNPIGFPDFFSDEGVYLRRALHVMEGLGPQETDTYYDHPFFGQILLAGLLSIVDYPSAYISQSEEHPIENLFAVPRILMGLFAIIDTFLIYKISESRYNRKIALVASILFAVMPMSWFMRRILLESIQLPFILSSILFALYVSKPTGVSIQRAMMVNIDNLAVLLSGILLGFAIFTKIPAFSMIPLIALLILKNHQSKKVILIWIIPIILIPLIWPAYSIAVGQFSYWWDTISLQSSREGVPILNTVSVLYDIDPVLFILTTVGLMFALFKRDHFIIFWAVPSFVFLFLVGRNYAPYQLFIPLVPLFCITSAVLIFNISNRIKIKNIRTMLPWTIITAAVGIFGLISSTMLITSDITSGQIQVIKDVQKNLGQNTIGYQNTILVSNPIYTWIFKYIYPMSNVYVLNEVNDFDYEPIKANKIVFISDVESNGLSPDSERLRTLYNTTTQSFRVEGFADEFNFTKYPYTSMIENYESMEQTEVRICTTSCINYD